MNELRNKDGLTEAEFLAKYDASKFPPTFVTVDIVLFHQGKVLLIRRGNHPWLGKLAFPGGFVEQNETAECAAARELEEETGAANVALLQLPAKTAPGRDPRSRIVTIPFLAHLEGETAIQAGDDAAAAEWWDYSVEDNSQDIVVTLQNGKEKAQFTARRIYPQTGHPADIHYEIDGDSPLAADHAEIFASAWDTDVRNF